MDKLPGVYRGYDVVDGELPDGRPAIIIFHRGVMVSWDTENSRSIAVAHRTIDEWMEAP